METCKVENVEERLCKAATVHQEGIPVSIPAATTAEFSLRRDISGFRSR